MISLGAGAFTLVDELGRIHHPRVTAPGGGPLPRQLLPGQTVSLTVREVLPTGNGSLRMGAQRPAADRRVGLQRRDRLTGREAFRQYVDLTVSPGTGADHRAVETERQMTDEERSGLISSLIVVVCGGSREPPVPADVLQIAGPGVGLPRLRVPAPLIPDDALR